MMTNEQLAEAVARVKETMDNLRGVVFTFPDNMKDVADVVAMIPQMASLITQLWDEREQLIANQKTLGTYLDEAVIKQHEITIQQNRDVMRMARDDFADIAKRGVEPFTSHKWLFYCHDVASKQVAALDAALKGGE